MTWQGVKTLTPSDCYNVSDFNRIERNTAYLSEVLKVNVKQVHNVATVLTIPTVAYLENIENNIEEIANAFYVPGGWQKKREWRHGDTFDYNDANRIEGNLMLLYELFRSMNNGYRFCGDTICGGDMYV